MRGNEKSCVKLDDHLLMVKLISPSVNILEFQFNCALMRINQMRAAIFSFFDMSSLLSIYCT